MSTWIIAGAPGRRAGCTRASTYDGDVTGPSTSIVAAIPLASIVFPAPSGPESTTTSPARNCPPSRDPSAMVSSTDSRVAAPGGGSSPLARGDRKRGEAGRGGSSPLAIAPQPFPQPPGGQGSAARSCPLDQPDQP